MKTNFLKIIPLFVAGIFCCIASADARKLARPSKKRHLIEKRLSSSALADMKIKNVEFGFNKTTIPDNATNNLNNVAKLMKDNNAALKLGGYADNKGGYVYNWKLSKARAESVKAYLVSQGADSSRIAATEYGYTHPIASNKSPIGRKKNRRVEIHFAN